MKINDSDIGLELMMYSPLNNRSVSRLLSGLTDLDG